VQVTRIEVAGNADRSGTPPTTWRCRAARRRGGGGTGEAGRGEQAITIQAFGDTRPLVPTAAGVREPQNRRVEIVFR